MDRIFANECGNLDVHFMGVFYGYSLWMNRILAMNLGMWMSCLVLMGVFYGYPFGWTEISQWMNVGVMGVFYGYAFGWTEILQ